MIDCVFLFMVICLCDIHTAVHMVIIALLTQCISHISILKSKLWFLVLVYFAGIIYRER